MGDLDDLQELEDDGLLEEVLKRRACLRCGARWVQHGVGFDAARGAPFDFTCRGCDGHYREILPGVNTIEEVLQTLRRGLLDGALDCGRTTVAAGPPPQTPDFQVTVASARRDLLKRIGGSRTQRWRPSAGPGAGAQRDGGEGLLAGEPAKGPPALEPGGGGVIGNWLRGMLTGGSGR
mmetsp:Transcript_815/g.2169  ORF Transcript_815/g.2169 Transcript_815/m.2169 type:complete len:178 (+) Transcript_815:93-626(+)